MKGNYCLLWLTCKDNAEAAKIADTLLAKHLVACVKTVPVESGFRWKGKVESTKEIWVYMESRIDLFNMVEAEVKKLHSYDTFVLEATPILKISKDAEVWLKKELKNGKA